MASLTALLAAPPPPIAVSTSGVTYNLPPQMPADRQNPHLTLLHPDLTSIIVPPYSAFDPAQFAHASDFEDAEIPVMAGSGADVLQYYMSNPTLASNLPYDESINAYGPVMVSLTAFDDAGNEAEPLDVPVHISAPASACNGAEILCPTGQCSTEGLCLGQQARDFLVASGLVPGVQGCFTMN